MTHSTSFPIPIWLLALDAAGVLLFGLGLFGLFAAAGTSAAILAEPAVAWGLVVVGGTLLAVAAGLIVLHLRQRARQTH